MESEDKMKKILIEDILWLEFRSDMTDNNLIIFPMGRIEGNRPP